MKSFFKSCILLLFILCVVSFLVIFLKSQYQRKIKEDLITEIKENVIENKPIDEEKNLILLDGEKIGLIIIPSINIEAPIFEGTSSDILKTSVGHFKSTSLWNGNVALASHNRGSYAHYFSKIKELKNGEEIIYITSMGERRYKVKENKIIEETNVKVLENTQENTITLITCVTGQRNKRQCVIGIEI